MLIENNVGPILLLGYTNHALDNLTSVPNLHSIQDPVSRLDPNSFRFSNRSRAVVDAEITRDIVRLGSQSKDEVVETFSINNIEKLQPASRA